MIDVIIIATYAIPLTTGGIAGCLWAFKTRRKN